MSRISQRVFVGLCVAVAVHIFILYLPVSDTFVSHPAIRATRQITISFDEFKPLDKSKPAPEKNSDSKVIPARHKRKIVKKIIKPIPSAVIKIKPKKIVRRPVEPQLEHRLSKPVKTAKSVTKAGGGVKGSQNTKKPSAIIRVTRRAAPLYEINSPPVYPRIARRRGLEGTVIIEVLVDVNGRVAKAGISATSGYGILDRAALKAVKDWTFSPGSVNGKKEAMPVKVPVKFRLNG